MSKILKALTSSTGMSPNDIRKIILTAPVRYKHYSIKKRNGGERLISQPARELKFLQRAIMSEFLSKLPVHPSAMAYRPGISIYDNAAAHAANGPIYKFDFKDFFTSIIAKDWVSYCIKNKVFDEEEDIAFSGKILFHKAPGLNQLRLAIGAPSSPHLSNILMYDFDCKISDMIISDGVTYTRYADDMTFSARRTGFLNRVQKSLRRAIKETETPSLVLNELKTVLATKKYKRIVTGLVLTNDGEVSLGRDRKRLIRSMLYRFKHHKLEVGELTRLEGLLAFVNDVEPAFLERLIKLYGHDVIARLKSINSSINIR